MRIEEGDVGFEESLEFNSKFPGLALGDGIAERFPGVLWGGTVSHELHFLQNLS